MKKLIVDKKYDNKKLNKFLQDSIPNLSSNLFYKTLRKKDIKINGKRVNENITVFENDVIEVYVADNLLEKKLQRCWGYAQCCIVLSASVYASLPICIQHSAAHIIRCANTTEEKNTLFKGRKKLRRILSRPRH